ncbi:hypothetical protein ABH904_003397 [Pseudomonas frederiksbergensis]
MDILFDPVKMKKIRFGVSYYAPPFFCGDMNKRGTLILKI